MCRGTAAVIGLGLIGGSIARELSKRGVRVSGYDHDPASVHGAYRAGVVHRMLESELSGVEEAELVILAVPVDQAKAVLAAMEPYLGEARLIMDVGSTKHVIVEYAHDVGLGDRFVGAHPMAGDHRSGWGVSRDSLFDDRRVYLCPTATTDASVLELAHSFWRRLGAVPECLDARVHDELLAWTSHLPQTVSTALALVLDAAGVRPEELGTGGRDVTRLAGSSPEMWTGILLENRAHLEVALAALGDQVERLRRAVRLDDREAVYSFLSSAHRWRGAGEG